MYTFIVILVMVIVILFAAIQIEQSKWVLRSAVPSARGGALRASVVEGTISASNLELISERG